MVAALREMAALAATAVSAIAARPKAIHAGSVVAVAADEELEAAVAVVEELVAAADVASAAVAAAALMAATAGRR